MHRRLEQAVAALAVALGAVHRDVGVAQQLLGAAVVAGARDRDADAGAQRRPSRSAGRSGALSASRMRCGGVRGRPGCRRPRAARRTRRRRSAPRCRRRARCASSRRRDLDQQLVAGGVAERVVDRLEVVEVEEDDGQRARPSRPRAGERVRDAVDEQRAVGQPGDGSWNAWWVSWASKRLALGDVARVEQDAADVLLVDQVREVHLEDALLAVAVGAACTRTAATSWPRGRPRSPRARACGPRRSGTTRAGRSRGCDPPTGWRR